LTGVFGGDIGRRIATIDGQLKGIDRLLQTGDILQVLTQSAAVRNALESLVRVLLQTSIAGRFGIQSIDEKPEDVFEHALERAMSYWLSSSSYDLRAVPSQNGANFPVAARQHIRAMQDRLRDVGYVLEGHNYLQTLRELGAIRAEIDELVKLALSEFIKDRVQTKRDAKKARNLFERTVEQALKYWHLPDPRAEVVAMAKTSRKILVVDDDPDVVEFLRYILKKSAYEVVTAANADEAMSQVEAEKPDLIILDIMMPKGTEGFQFTWRLRSRPEPEYRNIPIIVVTAIHDTTSLRFYPEQSDGTYGPGEYLPVEAFIDKPVNEEELLQRIERILGVAAQETG
jgi:CheY-like chemotaxis protein/DNA-binding FrmR family transcriptional regulator